MPHAYTLVGELCPLLMLNQHSRKSQRMPGVQSEVSPALLICEGGGRGEEEGDVVAPLSSPPAPPWPRRVMEYSIPWVWLIPM